MNNEARHLAGYGRYGDNNLVHVSNRELRGLESLTGRKFTKNPDTGLPEAFGFEDLLPAIAGGVATIFTGGMAAPALAAAITAAGVSAAKGNDIGTALTSGLISGVGSYAGAGLLSGVGDAANAAASTIPANLDVASAGYTGAESAMGSTAMPDLAGTSVGTDMAATGAATNPTPVLAGAPNAPVDTSGLSGMANAQPATAAGVPVQANSMTVQPVGLNSQTATAIPSAAATPPATSATPASLSETASSRLADAGKTIGNIYENPGAAASKLGSNLMSESGLKQAAMLGGSMYAQSQLPNGPPAKPPAERPWNYKPTLGNIVPHPANMPGSSYQPGISPEWRYFSDGGPVRMAEGGAIHMADGGFASMLTNTYAPEEPAGPTSMNRSFTPAPAGYRPGIDPQWNYFGGTQSATPAVSATPATTSSGMIRNYVAAPEGYRPGVDPQWNYFQYSPDPNAGNQGAVQNTGPVANLDESGGGTGSGDGDGGEGGAVGGSVRGGHLHNPPGSNPQAHKGLASLSKTPHGTTSNIVNEAKAAMVGEHPNPKQALQRFRETFGDSALRALSESFAEGGRIRGAGGGLDDLVPGTIDGRQKVRLADGEFVVSSDVVSALGDGSTDQGVRKLQEMMNRVRREKTGKTKQPGPISSKAMPA